MKIINYFTCAALLALCSCTSEVEEGGLETKTNVLSFNAYPTKTRTYTAGDVTLTEMKQGSFGVIGYTDDNKLYLGTKDKAVEQVWNSTTNCWEYKEPSEMKYWPSSGKMDFFAYFPFSDSGDVFAESYSEGSAAHVMTIQNNTGNQDVLFAYVADRTRTDLVHLQFHHAFAKVAGVKVKAGISKLKVEVKQIEVINTQTKGKLQITAQGNASYLNYEGGNTPRIFSFAEAKVVQQPESGENNFITLVENADNGYVFATNQTLQNNVIGTNTPMWDGNNKLISGSLTTKGDICLKLTCKVSVDGHYYLGDASGVNEFGDMYIPMTNQETGVYSLLAGKRYFYEITMNSNVGFKENGEPVLPYPIKFTVDGVTSWDDVTYSITL